MRVVFAGILYFEDQSKPESESGRPPVGIKFRSGESGSSLFVRS